MATKTVAWNSGSGVITLTYAGQGNGSVSVSSDSNEGIDRELSITVETTNGNNPKRENVTIKQNGMREVFSANDGAFILADSGTLNVLKE